jgi:hypothetical protein
MIRGLEKEWVNVDMQSYGYEENNLCFGCAATNTLCELMGEPFNENNIISLQSRRKKVNFGIDSHTLGNFEMGLDHLREARTEDFLYCLEQIEKKTGIKIEEEKIMVIADKVYLPILTNENYKINLRHYEVFAEALKKEGL